MWISDIIELIITINACIYIVQILDAYYCCRKSLWYTGVLLVINDYLIWETVYITLHTNKSITDWPLAIISVCVVTPADHMKYCAVILIKCTEIDRTLFPPLSHVLTIVTVIFSYYYHDSNCDDSNNRTIVLSPSPNIYIFLFAYICVY